MILQSRDFHDKRSIYKVGLISFRCSFGNGSSSTTFTAGFESWTIHKFSFSLDRSSDMPCNLTWKLGCIYSRLAPENLEMDIVHLSPCTVRNCRRQLRVGLLGQLLTNHLRKYSVLRGPLPPPYSIIVWGQGTKLRTINIDLALLVVTLKRIWDSILTEYYLVSVWSQILHYWSLLWRHDSFAFLPTLFRRRCMLYEGGRIGPGRG